MFQPWPSLSHSEESQARWELRHVPAESLKAGDRGASPTPGYIITYVCRPGYVQAYGLLWHSLQVMHCTKTTVKQSHLYKWNHQLADNKGLRFLPPVPRHTSLGCCGERTDRGTDCLGKQGRAGTSCGWPLLPCQKTSVLNMS